MFSCSHLSHFLSDPITMQSDMSKRGQETTSSEGSPMAKPTPMVPAKAKPDNLVSHSPWSATENPPQDLGYPVNPVNVDEGQGDHASTRRLVRTTQNPEVQRSQEASHSAGTRRLARAATPRTGPQNSTQTINT